MIRFICRSILIFSILTWLFFGYMVVSEYYPLFSAGRASDQGNHDQAIRTYRQALWMHPDSDTLNFSMAVALYRKGDYRQAAVFFNRAMSSKDRELLQKAQYNSGNCWYRLAQGEGNGKTSISLYGKSLDHYQRALLCNAGDGDTRHNRDLAAKGLAEAGRRALAQAAPSPGEGSRGENGAQPPGPQGQKDPAGHRPGGLQGVQERGPAEGLQEKRAEGGKGQRPLPLGRGEMTPAEAELLLEEARWQEQPGLALSGKPKGARPQEVEKDW